MRNLCWSLALMSAMWSCSPNEVTPPTPPTPPPTTPPPGPVDTPPKMKDWVMTTAYGDFISTTRNVKLAYDDNRRLKTWTLTSPDTDFSVHYENDTIHHVIFLRTDANGAYIGSSAIFLYRPDKRCEKVIYKKPLESYEVPYQDVINEENPYYSRIKDGDVYVLDSLVYSTTNQLTEIWEKRGWYLTLQKFVYADPQKMVPEKLQTYTSEDMVNLNFSGELTFTTNDMDQPAYRYLWISAFIPNLGPFTIALTPINPPSSALTKLVLVPKCITRYVSGSEQSPEFQYFYSADSTSFTGRLVTPGTTQRLVYNFEKQ
ncbi:hypothetical protein [Chitinophaga pinensis]|uniref:DUF4595 domain-containing protein n=1 Tax=Chitinophaga pinensis TaxID=79329 RepID=A0A5C6LKQ0_9BACT|nr:hypothetical protein [Chitinophaga pinensis]TWV88657.1 hypothetical protein FEF09_30355 [Chitinophaga pinensis]